MTPEEHDYVTRLHEEIRRLQERVRYLTTLASEQAQARMVAEAKIRSMLRPLGLDDFLEDRQ